ncbi:MAG: energy-coupling factor transporter transmembrane protein EcfT [Acholeplasmatales bacterium]|nr:energy-coupling factor transporter transmembrane protein EcfT [Acholeplasmatales bacterium]
MDNITFGQYIPGKSWIYKLDPRTKILLTIALIVLIFLIPNLEIMLIAVGVFFVLFLTTRVPFLKVLKGLRGVLFLLLFTVVLQLVYTKSTDNPPLYVFDMEFGLYQLIIISLLLILYFTTKKFIKFKFIYLLLILFLSFMVLWTNPFEKWYWAFNHNFTSFEFEVYKEGLEKSGFIFIRIVLMIGITSLLTLTTMSTDINNGIEWVLAPLKLIKVPVGVFSMLISLTLRFIPTLFEESKKIMKAQASRGVDFQEGKLVEKINQIIALLIPMFVLSFKRADDLSNAMEARGYVIGGKRTKLDVLKFRFLDYFSFIVMIALFVVVIWSRFYV